MKPFTLSSMSSGRAPTREAIRDAESEALDNRKRPSVHH
jgi:hypothetical protein